MKTQLLEFDCTHNGIDGTMSCSWLEGRVTLVEHFATKKTGVFVDGAMKATYDDLTANQFVNLQVDCQKMANAMIATEYNETEHQKSVMRGKLIFEKRGINGKSFIIPNQDSQPLRSQDKDTHHVMQKL